MRVGMSTRDSPSHVYFEGTMSGSTLAEPATHASGVAGGKFPTFALGREEFGIPILKVREIIG
jgi:hypothetical protein